METQCPTLLRKVAKVHLYYKISTINIVLICTFIKSFYVVKYKLKRLQLFEDTLSWKAGPVPQNASL